MAGRTLALVFGIICCLNSAIALASGTVRVQQNDGSVRNYPDVSLRIVHRTLRITSHDGKGTLIIDHAACSYVGELERCLPYGAKLQQSGKTRPITIVSGTIYFNPTSETQTLPLSSTRLVPRGILLSLRTKIGTYVSLSGKLDELIR
jgi:hypothetical protein